MGDYILMHYNTKEEAKKFMKNKKAFTWLMKKTFSIIISLAVILLLVIFVVKVYYLFKGGNELEKMKKQMENLVFSIKEVQEKVCEEKECEQTTLLFPTPGWYLKSFPDYDFPQGECRGAIGCLCICNDVQCGKLKQCEGFKFDVQLISTLTRVSSRYADPSDPYTPKFSVDYPGTLEFKEEVIEIKIVKEDIIKLYEVKNK